MFFRGLEGKEAKSAGRWIAAKNLKVGDTVLLSSGKNAKITAIEIEQLYMPETTYNFEVEGFHTYYVGEQGILVHNDCPLSNRELNIAEKKILRGENVTLNSKEHALQLIEKKFPNFPQEIAQARGPQGWHFDLHPIEGMGPNAIEHINIYSKALKFRAHIFWKP